MPTEVKMNPMPHAVPDPAPVKKARKPRAKKVQPEKAVDIPDTHPALASEPDPRIDAVAAAKQIAAQQEAPTNVEVRSAKLTWPEFEKQVMDARNTPPPAVVRPALTVRQAETNRLEVEAGARRVAAAQALDRHRVLPPPDPTEPVNTQVFRPRDFVPKHGSKDPAIASQHLK